MLMPVRRNPGKRRTAQIRTLPPPVGGLNAIDNIADMPEADALVLTNFFCQPDYVELRHGYESHATGLSTAVESLLTWHGPTGDKMFGAVTASIFEVTSAGAVGAADLTSLTNGRWQQTMMANAGGNFLVIANGADSIRNYDGSSWTTPSITGVSSATIDNVAIHARRLWMVEEDSTSAWYLPIDSIAGAALEINFGPLFSQGGKLVAIGSLTRDGGSGPDDFAVFLSSTGEVALFRGTDPANASTWSLVGVYYLPEPIGKRCLMKVGADLAVLTKAGVISLTSMLGLDRSTAERAAVTNKIDRFITEDATAHDTKFGWELARKPRSNMFLVNVPTSAGAEQRQWAMNTLSGAWSKFTGYNANCFGLLNGELYFGGNSGTVWKADVGFQDNSGGIIADMKTSFSYFGSRGTNKHFKLMRAMFESNGRPGFLMDLNIDFEDREPTSTPTASAVTGSLWDASNWDSAKWGGGATITRNWVGAVGYGEAAAIRLRVVSNGASFKLYNFDLVAELGLGI